MSALFTSAIAVQVELSAVFTSAIALQPGAGALLHCAIAVQIGRVWVEMIYTVQKSGNLFINASVATSDEGIIKRFAALLS